MALWLLGGSTTDSSLVAYSGLGDLGNWSQVQTCVEATTTQTTLRIQLYPTPGTPTVEIDDVDAHLSLAANGGFEDGGGPWTPYPGTGSNFVVYQGSDAHSGSWWGATNTATTGGGIYQDIPLSTTAGQLVCASAWLRNEGSATGASGSFVLWLLGGSTTDSGLTNYSNLGNGSDWSQVQTCVEATTTQTTLRIQLYPTPDSPTVEIDDVDAHLSLAANGGFETGSAPWITWPDSTFTLQQNTTVTVQLPAPPVQTSPVQTVLPTPTGQRRVKVRLWLYWTWSHATTRLARTRIGRLPAQLTLTMRCSGRGCPTHRTMTASGRRHVRRLLAAGPAIAPGTRSGSPCRRPAICPRRPPCASATTAGRSSHRRGRDDVGALRARSGGGPGPLGLGLVRALGGLVVGQGLRRVDVAERRMPGHEGLGGANAEPLGQHGAQRGDLHLSEAGQRRQVGAQRIAVGGVGPDTGGVAVVLAAHVRGEVMDPLGHRAGKAMDRGPDPEHRVEVGAGQRRRVDRAQPLAQRERARERLLDRHLLVEREADEQRHRLGRDQRVGLVGVGEVQAIGHGAIIERVVGAPSGRIATVTPQLTLVPTGPGTSPPPGTP
jgi:hypothetical protein